MSLFNEIVRRRAEEVAGGAVIATDVLGRILHWNQAAEELYGWASEEVLGLNIVDVTPALISQPEAAEVMKVLRTAESWTGTFRVRDKEGSTFAVDVTDTPIMDRYGKLIGIIGVSTRA
ncbi:MAG TPA: PAS domain-containing protein [Gemmatimonadaceae bacterium]|nr:PAS domain-containing protein [Gemmatimonadaceae bacterium]